jgi:hypothetical protein
LNKAGIDIGGILSGPSRQAECLGVTMPDIIPRRQSHSRGASVRRYWHSALVT